MRSSWRARPCRSAPTCCSARHGSVALTFHVEICEDIWMPVPPSSHAALAGAELLLNLSASNITIGKAELRRLLCGSQSARAIAAYAYSASGPGESTTDLAWDGHAAIYECGDQLVESARFEKDSTIVTADVDLGRIRQERLRNDGFAECALLREGSGRALPHHRLRVRRAAGQRRARAAGRALPLRAVRSRQAARQLLRGLQHPGPGPGAAPAVEPRRERGHRRVGRPRFDARADRLLPRDGPARPAASNIMAFTMPGFGTSDKTHRQCLEADERRSASRRARSTSSRRPGRCWPTSAIPSPRARRSTTSPSRTCRRACAPTILFRLANQHRGLVVGTGDLSELGLGWCTYGVGDHMSHYNPNGSVSKTLIQHLIRFVAASGDVDANTAAILHDILDTEISPELIPAGDNGAVQATESFVGPYALQDFNLFYLTRLGYRPSKIAFLAWNAWHDEKKGAWPANVPAAASAPIRWRRSIAGWSCSCGASSATSSSARRCPTDRRSRRAVRCRRAATGARLRTAAPMSGSAELAQNVPERGRVRATSHREDGRCRSR